MHMIVALTYLGFFAEAVAKLKKMEFFQQFKDDNREGKMKTTQMTPFCYLFFLLYLLITFISEFENTENSFSN